MTLTQAVHRHEHSIEELLQDVAWLKAEVALLRQELSYVRPVPSLRHSPAEIRPHVSPEP
jgi:hypothetical protein